MRANRPRPGALVGAGNRAQSPAHARASRRRSSPGQGHGLIASSRAPSRIITDNSRNGEGFRGPRRHEPMTNGPAIVIRGTREDWPGGPRTLRPLDPNREPNRQTFWFGAELDPGNEQVWFRITLEAVHRMQEETPGRPWQPPGRCAPCLARRDREPVGERQRLPGLCVGGR